MKKIRVTGCCNCPYAYKYSIGEESISEDIYCGHPSFHAFDGKQYKSPPITQYSGGIHDVEKLNPAPLYPDWCPLEYDVSSVSTCGGI